MSKQYLHLSVCLCDMCDGPVVSGSLTVRESEISRETDIRSVGDRCLSCGHCQPKVSQPRSLRHFPPVEWQPVKMRPIGEVSPRIELDLAARESIPTVP